MDYLGLFQELAGEPTAAAYLSAHGLMKQLSGLMAQLLGQLLASESGTGSSEPGSLMQGLSGLAALAPLLPLPACRDAGVSAQMATVAFTGPYQQPRALASPAVLLGLWHEMHMGTLCMQVSQNVPACGLAGKLQLSVCLCMLDP